MHSCSDGSQLSRANGSAHAELHSIDMLPVSAIKLAAAGKSENL